jgi:alpha-tubulin suppressor-like RCC1 family protein
MWKNPVTTLQGGLFVWGNDSIGQLGQNLILSRNSPVQQGSPEADRVFVATFGGSNTNAGSIKADGTLWLWGDNTSGQLGQNNVTSTSSPVQVGSDTDWAQVSFGISHVLALKMNGTLWAWGLNVTSGQLGVNDVVNRSSPTQVGGSWIAIAGSHRCSYGIKTDGTLWSWGYAGGVSGGLGGGQLGLVGSELSPALNRSVPTQIDGFTDWTAVTASGNINQGLFAAALREGGELYMWGDNNLGQLGQGITAKRSSPVQIAGAWSSVSAGVRHTAAIKTDGTLWTWGRNADGELGHGDKIDQSLPVQVGAATNWLQVSGGGAFTLALQTPGTLWAWGGNATAGTLGIGISGAGGNRSSPVQVGMDTNWFQVRTGFGQSMGIKTTT